MCGSRLSELTDYEGQQYVPVYSELLDELSSDDWCSITARGSCEDGKSFLFAGGLFVTEVYYFEGDTFVGKAWVGDVGTCGRCPFSGFAGTVASVRCDAPQWEPLCEPGGLTQEPFLPFANGESPGPCMDC